MCVAGSAVCPSPQIDEIILGEGGDNESIGKILKKGDSLVADPKTPYTDVSQAEITLKPEGMLKVRICQGWNRSRQHKRAFSVLCQNCFPENRAGKLRVS